MSKQIKLTLLNGVDQSQVDFEIREMREHKDRMVELLALAVHFEEVTYFAPLPDSVKTMLGDAMILQNRSVRWLSNNTKPAPIKRRKRRTSKKAAVIPATPTKVPRKKVVTKKKAVTKKAK